MRAGILRCRVVVLFLGALLCDCLLCNGKKKMNKVQEKIYKDKKPKYSCNILFLGEVVSHASVVLTLTLVTCNCYC